MITFVYLSLMHGMFVSHGLRTRCIVCICCGELEGVVVVMQFQYLSLPSSVL